MLLCLRPHLSNQLLGKPYITFGKSATGATQRFSIQQNSQRPTDPSTAAPVVNGHKKLRYGRRNPVKLGGGATAAGGAHFLAIRGARRPPEGRVDLPPGGASAGPWGVSVATGGVSSDAGGVSDGRLSDSETGG